MTRIATSQRSERIDVRVIDHHVDLETRDGLMNTFVTHPEEGGPFPVIIFWMDALGKREELHDMARRLGTAGYYVIVPNLYYRSVREFDGSTMTPEERRPILVELIGELNTDLVMSDAAAVFAHIDGNKAADSGNVAALGYCMSGPYSFATACVFPDRIKAAASMYGVKLHGENTPSEIAHQAKCELYFGCAETDDHAPQEMIDALDRHLANIGANYTIDIYKGTGHGFAFPKRETHHRAGAERHYEKLIQLFRRTIG